MRHEGGAFTVRASRLNNSAETETAERELA
jgi:hypothetical protein